jgi:signal peptidase II
MGRIHLDAGDGRPSIHATMSVTSNDPSPDPSPKQAARGGRATIDPPARRSARAWTLLLVVLVLGLVLDLASKEWAFRTVAGDPVELSYEPVVDGSFTIPWHPGVQAIAPDLLDFRLVLNRGAVFGIGQGRRFAFVAFTMIAIGVAIAVFGWWTRSRSWIAHLAIGLILAGGLGNLYDRVAVGAVRDFLHMLPRRELPMGISWPGGSTEVFPWVFNIADVELLAGMALLLIHVQLADRRERLLSTTTPDSDPAESKPADAARSEADQPSNDASA